MESPTKTYVVVILILIIYVGMHLLSKAAFDGGMSNFVFIFYRQAAATVVLLPLSLFLERKNIPPLTFVSFCKIFLLSFFGITTTLTIYGVALIYTSPTLAAATANCLPVITFILAIAFGMEALKLKTRPGIAKLVGIVTCMAGVAFLAFFKGPHFRFHWHFSHSFGQTNSVDHHSSKTWVKGCFLMLLSNFFWGLWLVFQGQVLKCYPSKLLFTSLQCLLSTIQSFGIAIVLERDPSQWKLGFDFRLFAVAYCGIVVTGVTYYLQAWVIEKEGPVFLAMCTPFSLILTMFISTFFLGKIITLGSMIGGGLLIVGLYSVLWGKNKENQTSLLAEKVMISELKQIKITNPTI